ncbi:MAG TPA: chorismate synthase [Ruminococcus sp.]|jgi:chorismate synthase|nr:chorismate synthase [Ruminococcus sp.]
MKNTFGTSVAVTIFGESHGAAVGAVVDGLAPGIKIDEDFIRTRLELRKPYGSISTPRREKDDFQIVSGVFEGKTTGTPVCILIPNTSQNSKDYEADRPLARPGHADYTAYVKYHGHEDYRGGGHFSGRVTAALVAAGAICLSALSAKGIEIGTHISRLGGISDSEFSTDEAELVSEIKALNGKRFAVLDEQKAETMQEVIKEAAADGDSIGGVLETAVTGLPAGVGEPWFDTLEGVLSHALFSIPGIKGVQFGGGFDLVDARGSEYNDAFRMESGRVVSKTNNNGGINGGISNGMPILFRCAVKPTPSIHIAQETVDFVKKEDAKIETGGRHDPAIIHRARAVVDSVAALALIDQLALRYGTDWLA